MQTESDVSQAIALLPAIDDLLAYEAEAFDNDEPVEAADFVDFFSQIRPRLVELMATARATEITTLLELVAAALDYNAPDFDDETSEGDYKVGGNDVLEWWVEFRLTLRRAYAAAANGVNARTQALLNLRQYIVFDPEGDLSRQEFDAMLAAADLAIKGRA
jgi:hypothetical protein